MTLPSERLKSSGGIVGLNDKMYNGYYDAPYYMQPAFTIPILVAIVFVFVIIIAAYVCIRRIKARAAAAAATSRKCSDYKLLLLNFCNYVFVLSFCGRSNNEQTPVCNYPQVR